LKEKSSELNTLPAKMEHHWGMEDSVYRFYHQSVKVYAVQALTEEAVGLLKSLLPERPLNAWFQQIVSEGTGRLLSCRIMRIGCVTPDRWSRHCFMHTNW
jgi:hypothetical protein